MKTLKVKSTANTPLAGLSIVSVEPSAIGGYKVCQIRQSSGKTILREIPDRWIEEVAA